MCFYHLYVFICDFLEFSLVNWEKFFKILTRHGIQQDGNFEQVVLHSRVCQQPITDGLHGFCTGIIFFYFRKFSVFLRRGKAGLIDFPEKRAPTKGKCLLPFYNILRNFIEGNARKFNVSFAAFCAVVDAIKCRKTTTRGLRS